MERCYAFGQALARIVSAMGVNTVVLASGGMSHYPGTERYAAPDLVWDRGALARIAAGNLKSLVGYDAAELDAAGNVELRCWACAVPPEPVWKSPRRTVHAAGRRATANLWSSLFDARVPPNLCRHATPLRNIGARNSRQAPQAGLKLPSLRHPVKRGMALEHAHRATTARTRSRSGRSGC